MFSKSMNIQKEIKVDENRVIAFLNAQISVGYGIINTSMQIVDKVYLEDNPVILKDEYNSFIEEVKNEAVNNGWEALKETEAI